LAYYTPSLHDALPIFRQVQCNFKREYINRVILLSDGLANRGIINPAELDRIASSYRPISLSTMGVGLDYNENLMLGLAESGGGKDRKSTRLNSSHDQI